ncbi:MAG: threonine--tRNA ligase [Candidatus Lindowbacteria bacterium RIFCSPLOWO2_12_FULL_62_27]|nr:MAG: threonine--tRNA ligase [Candidatus Lindowbacteria bacterium RIFCSPLOWO2_12_FULL_62_27]
MEMTGATGAAFAEDQDTFWHTTTHIMAQAVCRLFPSARYAIGPTIEAGFYYDFDLGRNFLPEDLEKIEAEMRKIVEENHTVEHMLWTKPEAAEFFEKRGQMFKVELIQGLPEGKVSIYRQGEFTDLCRGPHLKRTGLVRHFKLLSFSGCYWRANDKGPKLQRIYGISYQDTKMLTEFVRRREEAEKRDHRRLGVELDLFSMDETLGGGLVLYHPKGSAMRAVIEDFLKRAHRKLGYEYIYSPHMANANLWKISGHYENYKENMYFTQIEEQEFGIKPMNCPFHIQVYRSHLRSYRELPIRYFELGTVYRFERSGVLHGLLRVRGFTQDDAHIFCREDQLTGEIERVLDFVRSVLRLFGFSYTVGVGTRPEKYMGDPALWDRATAALRAALEARQMAYEMHEGDGAFYGPKIDVALKDALGRSWQGPTIQVDFNLPQRFELEYVGEGGDRKCPVMIHRAILGSLERFIGCLIEHYAGDFPLWLAPVQARVIAVAESAAGAYSREVLDQLRASDVRADSDNREETLGKRIRAAELEKIPVIAVLGEREAQGRSVNVRRRGKKDQEVLSLTEFVERMRRESATPDGAIEL